MVADPFPESRMCPLAEPQGTPADKGTKAQPRRHTGKAKKRKAEEIQTPGAELGPSTSGRPVPQRGASSARHEIDELFAAKPPKAPAPPQQSAEKAPPQRSARKGKALGSKDDLFGAGTAKARRRLEGLPVYSAEELGVDQGGGTPECPFDCDCCF